MTICDKTLEERQGLERIFATGHRWHDRIFYDACEGAYYDRWADLYLSLDETRSFGIK